MLRAEVQTTVTTVQINHDKAIKGVKVTAWVQVASTSGHFSEVSMAKPGPKPVRDLTLVEVGNGRLH